MRNGVSTACQSGALDGDHSRIRKNIHGNLLSVLVQRFLDIESPQESRHGQKGTLFGETLATADASSPAERHVSFVIGERPMQRMSFVKSFRAEPVGLGEFVLITVNGPNISLDPGVLGNEPILRVVRTWSSSIDTLQNHLTL